MDNEFDKILNYTSYRLSRVLSFIPDDIKKKCEEIRIRKGLPLCLTVAGKVMFIASDSSVTTFLPKNCFIADNEDVTKTLSLLCNNSVYLHESEIKQGFVSVTGGYRAGVCGSFNADGMLIRVNSINIRIARQIFDCGTNLVPYATDGLLIAGPPGSGKTTILRDVIRLLSNGNSSRYYRVVVIDSRGEISGGSDVFDLGVNTDVLYTENKAIGTQIALRTMFPNIIAFDEIGTTLELDSVKDCFNAGVGIITTVHCHSKDDLMCRKIVKNIIESGAISNIALLGKTPGDIPQIIDVKRLKINAYS